MWFAKSNIIYIAAQFPLLSLFMGWLLQNLDLANDLRLAMWQVWGSDSTQETMCDGAQRHMFSERKQYTQVIWNSGQTFRNGLLQIQSI